jgi:hypothetical protein
MDLVVSGVHVDIIGGRHAGRSGTVRDPNVHRLRRGGPVEGAMSTGRYAGGIHMIDLDNGQAAFIEDANCFIPPVSAITPEGFIVQVYPGSSLGSAPTLNEPETNPETVASVGTVATVATVVTERDMRAERRGAHGLMVAVRGAHGQAAVAVREAHGHAAVAVREAPGQAAVAVGGAHGQAAVRAAHGPATINSRVDRASSRHATYRMTRRVRRASTWATNLLAECAELQEELDSITNQLE